MYNFRYNYRIGGFCQYLYVEGIVSIVFTLHVTSFSSSLCVISYRLYVTQFPIDYIIVVW